MWLGPHGTQPQTLPLSWLLFCLCVGSSAQPQAAMNAVSLPQLCPGPTARHSPEPPGAMPSLLPSRKGA